MEQIKELLSKTPVMVILMGIPASGKSTFCQRYLSELLRINLDTIGTRHKESMMLSEVVGEGKNVVIDNTNVMRDERSHYIALAKGHGYHVIGLFFKSVVRDCVARNELREGKAKIPSKAIAAKSNQLQLPSYDEGFEKIYFVEIIDNDYKITDWNE